MNDGAILAEKRIGYHSNEKEKICKCIKEKSLLISYDTHYLGDGMYFWTNERDCEYWYKEQLRKSENSNIIKTVWDMEYNKDSIFDLTNDEEFFVLKKIATMLSVDSDLCLGVLINTLFQTDNKTIKEYINNYKIFRCFIHYPRKDDVHSISYSSKLKNQNFDTKSREILCVKSFDIINFINTIRKEE